MYVTLAEMARRVIEPEQFVADPRAFVDVRLPQSKGKQSYSFIGPGVSQNSEQVINLMEPHGFNVGAASLPAGAVNNPHLHFTAEVFICTRGSFRFTVGLGERAESVDVGVGDVLSIPTWVFRSFENTGLDEGWVFTVLGHDITGGIIWAPDVLTEAAETGLYLTVDGQLLDTVNGDSIEGVERMPLMSTDDVASLHQPSAADLRARLLQPGERNWSRGSLLSSSLPGHDVHTAPIIGNGFSQAPNPTVPIEGHHGFSLSWLSASPHHQTGLHRVMEDQVAYLIDGQWEIQFNDDTSSISRPEPGSVVSLPAGSWRNLRSVGDDEATLILATNGDARPTIDWSPSITQAAHDNNVSLDANRCVCPAHLVHHRGGTGSSTPDLNHQQPITGREK